MSNNQVIYKIVPRSLWEEAQRAGRFDGAPVDLEDGYIHFSTAGQAAETAAKHFRGQDDLLLVAIDTAALGSALKWEPSRGGDLFPHLYNTLDLSAARQSWALSLDENGIPQLPEGLA